MDLIADDPMPPRLLWKRGPGIPKPHTLLPWKLDEADMALNQGDYTICNKEGHVVGAVDWSFDLRYILETCNEFPALIDLLERIEATTNDRVTADTIRQYLKQTNIWT